MKKSDKLLLGGFLTGLLLLTAIQVTLYAKYQIGNYTVYNADDDLKPQAMRSFAHIQMVSVRNVADAEVKFGDMAQVEKDEDNGIQYILKGDTLLITGKNRDYQPGFRQPVIFHLPYNGTLSVFNSFLSFKPGNRKIESNPVINMQKSRLFFSGSENPLQLGHVKIVASDSSSATFYGNTQVNNLEVDLTNSSIEYTEGNFGQLSIVTDSVSLISLQSKHLLKATIKARPRE